MNTELDLPSSLVLRDIPGWPNYRAGSDGSIWSRRRWGRWKRLNQTLGKITGRFMVSLFPPAGHPGKRKVVSVHRLVLAAFVGPVPSSMVACHNNGDCKDNRPENLRWDTPVANEADKIAHGTNNRGDRNGQAKLDDLAVRAIRGRLSEGVSQRQVAREFEVSQSNVSFIATRKIWSHIE
jgi:hypothetical protein